MEPLGIALLGCGTVGGGVARILSEHADRITSRSGRPIVVKRVVVRDPYKSRPHVPPALIGTDASAAIHDPSVQVVVELIGGTTTARDWVLAVLAAGKHVVTANKALLAYHGTELFDAARKYERTVAFEASVCGGIPIIAAPLAMSLGQSNLLHSSDPQRHEQFHPLLNGRARPDLHRRPG